MKATVTFIAIWGTGTWSRETISITSTNLSGNDPRQEQRDIAAAAHAIETILSRNGKGLLILGPPIAYSVE